MSPEQRAGRGRFGAGLGEQDGEEPEAVPVEPGEHAGGSIGAGAAGRAGREGYVGADAAAADRFGSSASGAGGGEDADVVDDDDGRPGARSDSPDDEMDAFFPSVARAAATGQDMGAILDEELLVKALAERDEYLDALRRLQADFDNFRKRTERQLADVRARASESLLDRLLPVLDALDLALAHLCAGNPAAAPEAANWAGAGDQEAGEQEAGEQEAGEQEAREQEAREQEAREQEAREQETARNALSQVGALLRDTLAKEGLERIDEVGVAFDPTVHDAVAHSSAEDGEGGAVVDEVLRAGYLLKGRVLRPAMVKVRG